MQGQYITNRKGKTIIIAAIIAAVITAWLVISLTPPAENWKPDKEYPMVNRNIEWTGAGYNGR